MCVIFTFLAMIPVSHNEQWEHTNIIAIKSRWAWSTVSSGGW